MSSGIHGSMVEGLACPWAPSGRDLHSFSASPTHIVYDTTWNSRERVLGGRRISEWSVLLFFITVAIIRRKDSVVSHVHKAKWGQLSVFQGVWGSRWNPWVRGGSMTASSFIHMSGVFDIGCRLSVMGTLTWCVFVWLGFLTACTFSEGHLRGQRQTRTVFPSLTWCQRLCSITSTL